MSKITDAQVGAAMHAVERYYASQGIISVAESVDFLAMRAALEEVMGEKTVIGPLTLAEIDPSKIRADSIGQVKVSAEYVDRQYEYRAQHPDYTEGLKSWAYWTTKEIAEEIAQKWGKGSWLERRIVAGPIERLAEEPRQGCPDGGTCHHECVSACWRVSNAGPLSGVFPNDEWPVPMRAREKAAAMREGRPVRDGYGKPLTVNDRGEWVNDRGDTPCPNDGEMTNKQCWKCEWVREEGRG